MRFRLWGGVGAYLVIAALLAGVCRKQRICVNLVVGRGGVEVGRQSGRSGECGLRAGDHGGAAAGAQGIRQLDEACDGDGIDHLAARACREGNVTQRPTAINVCRLCV